MHTASTSGARTTSRQSASTRRMPNSLATRSPDSRERLATATNSTPGCFRKPGMCRLRVLRPAPTKPTRIGLSLMDAPPAGTARHGTIRREFSRRSVMSQRRLRILAVAAVVLTLVAVAALPARRGEAQGPITLSLIDVSGDLSSTRVIVENYQKANPDKVKAVTFQRAPAPELPAKFMYARPANSGPGRSILCGLPFILGDKKPNDPVAGWDKTWAFLKEIGESVEYYPTGTAITLKEFAEGTRWIIAGIMEWDMKPRAEGTIPPESKIFILPNTSFVIDGHYWAIPKGVSAAEQEVVLDLMKFMRRPEQQALTWKAFIGPSIKAATLDRAPPDIQKLVQEHWRPEYTDMEKKYKIVPQLPVKELIAAMDRWDKEVGAQRIKKF